MSSRFILLSLLVSLAIVLTPACRRNAAGTAEYNYVSAPQANLRDRVAPLYNKVAIVHNGERVKVLEKQRRFVRVRTEEKAEGWIEQRYLVGAEVYQQFQQLSRENGGSAAQAKGITRASLNLHAVPGRETDHLYQIKESERVEIIKRATAEKPASMLRPAEVNEMAAQAKKSGEDAAKPLEDWLLIRDQQAHTGWALARMVDTDVPFEIAQYAEGQRIVAAFVLNRVKDGEKQVPQYLTLVTENKDGLPFDFNQLRVYTWNGKRHRYETAYRERNLNGAFPATVGTEDFGGEGVLPTFTLRVKDDQGNTSERKYRLSGPIVRRILSPEDEQKVAAQKAQRVPARRHR